MVKELVQLVLSSEMQHFQEVAAAIKQTQSSTKAAEGIIAIIIIGIGSRVPNLRVVAAGQLFRWTGMIGGVPSLAH